ncbi:MAG: hypothetical protein ACYC69_17535 [Thermodesulfovibrionales bacterium]
MFWSFSFQLMPDEKVIEDSTQRPQTGIKASYSVFLSDKRAIFRFDGLGSSLTQSFYYHEIREVRPIKRLFITYLDLRTDKRNILLNIADAEYWAGRIREMKGAAAGEQTAVQPAALSSERKKRELLDMLTILHKQSLLTDEELDKKIHQLDSLKL